jgi:hypothetical protein
VLSKFHEPTRNANLDALEAIKLAVQRTEANPRTDSKRRASTLLNGTIDTLKDRFQADRYTKCDCLLMMLDLLDTRIWTR